MAEDDEWWNDEGGGIVGLVGYSSRAMSGARWEAFNGGRSNTGQAPSEHARLHEEINYFVPLISKHVKQEVTPYSVSSRVPVPVTSRCADFYATEGLLTNSVPPEVDKFDEEEHSCNYEGKSILKSGDLQLCRNCWAHYDDLNPPEQSLKERLMSAKESEDVALLNMLLSDIIDVVKTLNGTMTDASVGLARLKQVVRLTPIKEAGVADLKSVHGTLALPLNLKSFEAFKVDLFLRAGIQEGVVDPLSQQADTSQLFTVLSRLADSATQAEIQGFQRWYSSKVGPAGTLMGIFALIRLLKYSSTNETLREHMDTYFAALKCTQGHKSVKSYMQEQDSLNTELSRLRRKELDKETMVYLFVLKLAAPVREHLISEYKRTFPDVPLNMQNVRSICDTMRDVTKDTVAVTYTKSQIETLAATAHEQRAESSRQHGRQEYQRQQSEGGDDSRRSALLCPFCSENHPHWRCPAAEGRPAETSLGSRTYECKFKIKDSAEGGRLRSSGGAHFLKAGGGDLCFWKREGFDGSVNGKRARLSDLWKKAGSQGRNPGTLQAAKLPDDRKAGFDVNKIETVAATGSQQPKAKRRKKNAKTKKQAKAAGFVEQLDACFGDEDRLGCIMDLKAHSGGLVACDSTSLRRNTCSVRASTAVLPSSIAQVQSLSKLTAPESLLSIQSSHVSAGLGSITSVSGECGCPPVLRSPTFPCRRKAIEEHLLDPNTIVDEKYIILLLGDQEYTEANVSCLDIHNARGVEFNSHSLQDVGSEHYEFRDSTPESADKSVSSSSHAVSRSVNQDNQVKSLTPHCFEQIADSAIAPLIDVLSCSGVVPKSHRMTKSQRTKMQLVAACAPHKGNSGGCHRSVTVRVLLDATTSAGSSVEADETIDTAAGLNYCVLALATRFILKCSKQIVSKGRYAKPAMTYAANETSMARLGWFVIKLTVKNTKGEFIEKERRYEIIEKCVLSMIQGVAEQSKSRAYLDIHDGITSGTMEKELFVERFPQRNEYPARRQVNHVEAVAALTHK